MVLMIAHLEAQRRMPPSWKRKGADTTCSRECINCRVLVQFQVSGNRFWLNKASRDFSPMPDLKRREWVFKYASGSANTWCEKSAAPGCQ